MEAGELDEETFNSIRTYARFSVERIDELDRIYEHDMIAFIKNVQESLVSAGLGDYTGEFHKHLTSYDVEDPALSIALRQSCKLIHTGLESLWEALRAKALEHKWTLMIANTHGQFAEPTTFGHLLLVYVASIQRMAVFSTHGRLPRPEHR